MSIVPPLLFDGPKGAAPTFAFSHGEGLGMESDFMNAITQDLTKSNIRTVRFEFPYMEKIRPTAKEGGLTIHQSC